MESAVRVWVPSEQVQIVIGFYEDHVCTSQARKNGTVVSQVGADDDCACLVASLDFDYEAEGSYIRVVRNLERCHMKITDLDRPPELACITGHSLGSYLLVQLPDDTLMAE